MTQFTRYIKLQNIIQQQEQFTKKGSKILMEPYTQYEPLKWPPELKLAQLHLKCSGPGKDNIQGLQCPCCGRFEKVKTKNWRSRDIFKDFKTYGGGIPAYFQLLKYCGFVFIALSVIIVIFHIYVLEEVCTDPQAKCIPVFKILKFCDSSTIYNTLYNNGDQQLADAFFYLQLITFVILILSTIGMKIYLNHINKHKIVKESKVFSEFSLMIKNIPTFYQIDDVRKQIQQIVPNAEICELFFVHQVAQYETKYKRLFDLYYEIKFTQDSIIEQRGGSNQVLKQLVQEYVNLYQEVDGLKRRLYDNNGRAIIVFNSIDAKTQVYDQLKIGECSKIIYHTGKLFGRNTKKLHFFADKIAQPQQIIWKYVGQSSVTKTKVRIETTLIVGGFMLLCFALLYFPILQVDQQKIKHPSLGLALNLLISIALIILSVVYRLIILRLMPRRHPSSRQSQSYFIVINTIIFHFLFYIIAPGTYYIIPIQNISQNIKLAQLFSAVVLFLIMNVIIAFVDVRYRIFNSRRKKLMSSWSNWGKFCQIRLHEQLRWPTFPVQFKLMVILNIWSFNAFYIFQIPYLLVFFAIVLLILYWVDKGNMYKHYKMQVYLSIELQMSIQRDYIIMFMVCVCCGYAATANFLWQYIFIGIFFIMALLINIAISLKKKADQKNSIQRTMTLAEVVRSFSANPKQSMIQNIIQAQNNQNFFILDYETSQSLGSVTYQYGYRQQYEVYLSQFKNKNILNVLEKAYLEFLKGGKSSQRKMSKESQLTEIKRNDTEIMAKSYTNHAQKQSMFVDNLTSIKSQQ